MKQCVAIYLRLSQEDVDLKTNRAKDESNSISAQRSLIIRHLDQTPTLCNLPRLEFCDDGFSGTNFERPAFQKMIDLVKKGEISCIVVKDLSRFGRDYIEVGDYLEHIFPFLGVRFKAINDHYDSSKMDGNTAGMDVAFKNLVYDYYSKDLSQRVKSAMRMMQRNGGYVSCCLYGYKVLPGQKHKMVIDPEAAPVVRRVFMDVIAGKSTSQIARELNAEGIPTPLEHKGVKRKNINTQKPIWTHSRICDMLGNLKYTGYMVNHTRESKKIRDSSQQRVPKEDWIIHENSHEAIVSMEEFEAAKAALRKVRPHNKKPANEGFPFYCAHCGRKLQRTYGTDVYFTCITPYWDSSKNLCRAIRWAKTDIENVILDALKAQIGLMSVKARSKAQNPLSNGTQLRQHMKVLQSQIDANSQQKITSYMDYREGRITKDEFIALRSKYENQITQDKEELSKVEVEYKNYCQVQDEILKERSLARHTSSLDDKALKEIMYDAVERVNISSSDNIEIVWKFDDLFESIPNQDRTKIVKICPYNNSMVAT